MKNMFLRSGGMSIIGLKHADARDDSLPTAEVGGRIANAAVAALSVLSVPSAFAVPGPQLVSSQGRCARLVADYDHLTSDVGHQIGEGGETVVFDSLADKNAVWKQKKITYHDSYDTAQLARNRANLEVECVAGEIGLGPKVLEVAMSEHGGLMYKSEKLALTLGDYLDTLHPDTKDKKLVKEWNLLDEALDNFLKNSDAHENLEHHDSHLHNIMLQAPPDQKTVPRLLFTDFDSAKISGKGKSKPHIMFVVDELLRVMQGKIPDDEKRKEAWNILLPKMLSNIKMVRALTR